MKILLSKMNGVKRSAEKRPATLGATPVSPYSAWTRYAIPTYNQNFPSCVGHATANWFEMMLRRHVGRDVLKPGQQLDGDAIWRKARAMFYPREKVESGGLLMDHGFRAAIALGLLPPDSGVMCVHMDVGMISRMLRTEPVLQGTAVHAGWQHPSPESGQIPFKMPDPKAGHATCIVGVLEQDGEPYVLFQNSWGKSWGMGGYGLLRADQWEQCLLGPVAVCKLPDNWIAWNGWRDFLITP
jgi:hypothetical protein